jgi:hypothetical protein
MAPAIQEAAAEGNLDGHQAPNPNDEDGLKPSGLLECILPPKLTCWWLFCTAHLLDHKLSGPDRPGRLNLCWSTGAAVDE